VLKENEVLGVIKMLFDIRFSKVVMKVISNMFFEMSLDRPFHLMDVGFTTRT